MDGIEDMSNRDVIAQPIVDLLGEHELDATPNTAPRPACSPIFSQYQFAPEESLPPQVLHQLPPEATAEVHNSVSHHGEESKAGSGSEVVSDKCQDNARQCDESTSGMAAKYSASQCDDTAHVSETRAPTFEIANGAGLPKYIPLLANETMQPSTLVPCYTQRPPGSHTAVISGRGKSLP